MKTDDQMILNVIETAKKNLKESEMLLPTFFIGNKDSMGIVGAPFDGGEAGKDMVAQLIKKMAREMNAEFVVFLSESWTLPQDAAKEFMENRKKYPSVSSHPKAYEIVMFTLETKTSQFMGIAEILPGREMGEVKWHESQPGQISGRFTHFLGPKPVRH